MRRGKPPTDPLARLLSNVEFTESCWTWQRMKTDGYGTMRVGSLADGSRRFVYVHRWLYEQLYGELPSGVQLDHLCRNRACVCPDHLEPVTSWENTRRGMNFTAIQARRTHCPKGHAYDAANTYEWRGQRHCKTCRHDRDAARYHRPSTALT